MNITGQLFFRNAGRDDQTTPDGRRLVMAKRLESILLDEQAKELTQA
jgi:hypothetical protein